MNKSEINIIQVRALGWFISKMIEKNPGVSNETIAKQLNLDFKEVDRIVGNRSKNQNNLNTVVF